MPANTVKVDRSTKWGNPFHQDDHGGRAGAVGKYRDWARGGSGEAVALRRAAQLELRGKNLACWCPPQEPCHVDVLLVIANRERA